MMLKPIEARVLAHRYLYYVKLKPVITDYQYDILNKRAQEVCHKSSLIHKKLRDNEADYPQEAKDLSGWFLEDRFNIDV